MMGGYDSFGPSGSICWRAVQPREGGRAVVGVPKSKPQTQRPNDTSVIPNARSLIVHEHSFVARPILERLEDVACKTGRAAKATRDEHREHPNRQPHHPRTHHSSRRRACRMLPGTARMHSGSLPNRRAVLDVSRHRTARPVIGRHRLRT